MPQIAELENYTTGSDRVIDGDDFGLCGDVKKLLAAGLSGDAEQIGRFAADLSVKSNVPETVYECALCRDTGWRFFKRDEYGVKVYDVSVDYVKAKGETAVEKCACHNARFTRERLERSGLAEQISTCRLDNFNVLEDWQCALYATAKRYYDRLEGWLLLCGQNGSGKTHLCAAIFGKVIQTTSAVYMPWVEAVKEIKSLAGCEDKEDYVRVVGRLTHANFLYIDDLFKTNRRGRGEDPYSGITDADTRIAFEILDYRSRNSLRTMISCEWNIGELYEIDPAIGRIAEKCGKEGYCFIKRDISRDYRLREFTEV